VLDGDSPTIRGTTITGNALLTVRVEDAEPVIGSNISEECDQADQRLV